MLTTTQVRQFRRDGYLNGGRALDDAAVGTLADELDRVIAKGTAGFKAGEPRPVGGFLAKRGLFLVFLEVAVMGFLWTGDFPPKTIWLQVIWAIGWSMVAFAALSRLPMRAVGAVAVGIIAGHNLLDAVTPTQFGSTKWLWKILHHERMMVPFAQKRFIAAYPMLP